MAQKSPLSNPINSMSDINNILRTFNRPTLKELDKNFLRTLLSGFRVIVENLENDKSKVDLNDAIQWLQLFLRSQMLIARSLEVDKDFSKAVPIAVTYILGWLKHAPNSDANFYTEVLTMTWQLINLIDPKILKNFEKFGKEAILLLWDAIDEVGQYNTQMQILQIFIFILKNFSHDSAIWMLTNLKNVNTNEIFYKIMDLLRMRKDVDLFKQSARSILNQYNSQRRFDVQVHSFYCKSFELCTNFKFIKPSYSNRFWFDMNKSPYTLTFEGRIAPKGARKYKSVNVSLKINEMFLDKNILNIKFEPPVEILGFRLENEDLNMLNTARLSLCVAERHRFVKIFKVRSQPKPALEILSVVNVTPNIPLSNINSGLASNKKHTESCNYFINVETGHATSGNSLIKNNAEPPLFGPLMIENRKSVRSLSKTNSCNEYEDVDVSDAEPCQSYKNFSKRKNKSFATITPLAVKSRSFLHKDLLAQHTPCKRLKEVHVLDDGPCTSNQASSRMSLINNDFDALKNDCSYNDMRHQEEKNFIFMRPDVNSYNLTITNEGYQKDLFDSNILKSKNDAISKESQNQSSMDYERCNQFLLNSKTPKTQTKIDSISNNHKKSPASVPYEESISQALVSCEKIPADRLLYQKRSDSESSSDDESEQIVKASTPKRKSIGIQNSNAKRYLFPQNFAKSSFSYSASTTGCEVTEIVLVTNKNFKANVERMRTAFSSILKMNNSDVISEVILD